MSNTEEHPVPLLCGEDGGRVGVEIITARDVPLGGPRAMTVHRTLPQRRRSLIGAWCFLDHYGPDPVGTTGGMDVPPHPHTGLQTVSWLFDGQVRHNDSHGVHETVRPGELNLMTAGAGICHSEVSTDDTTTLHGVQLWTVLPESARHGPRRFDHYAPEPVGFDGGTALVFLGSLLGAQSPVPTFTPLVGAELRLDPGATLRLAVDPSHEHGILVDAGQVTVEGRDVARTELAYTGTGAGVLTVANPGAERARLILIGGTPFTEDVVMWWNFIGRDDAEIRAYREEWNSHGDRFGETTGYTGHDPDGPERLNAPEMPHSLIRPRSNPAAVARTGDDPYGPTRRTDDHAQHRGGTMTDKTDRTDKTGVPVTVRLVDEGGAYGIYLDGSGTPAGATYFLDGNDGNDGNDTGGAGDRIFFHTTVGDDYAGRGLAGILVDEALADTRSQGRTVVPVCPYVRSWTEKHHWDGQLRMPDGRDLAAVRAHTTGGDR